MSIFFVFVKKYLLGVYLRFEDYSKVDIDGTIFLR